MQTRSIITDPITNFAGQTVKTYTPPINIGAGVPTYLQINDLDFFKITALRAAFLDLGVANQNLSLYVMNPNFDPTVDVVAGVLSLSKLIAEIPVGFLPTATFVVFNGGQGFNFGIPSAVGVIGTKSTDGNSPFPLPTDIFFRKGSWIMIRQPLAAYSATLALSSFTAVLTGQTVP